MRGVVSRLVFATAIAAATTMAAAASEVACDAFSLNDVKASDAGTCNAGVPSCPCVEAPEVIAESQGSVSAFQIDETYAYWIASTSTGAGAQTLYRVNLHSPLSSTEALASSRSGSEGWTGQLAVGPGAAYVVTSDDAGNTGSFLQVPFNDAGPLALWPLPAVPIDPAVSEGRLYWTDFNADVCANAPGARLPAGDSGCAGAALPVTFDAGRGFTDTHLAVAGSVTYLLSAGQIWQWSPGDAGELLASSLILPAAPPNGPPALVANASGVFFAQENATGMTSTLQGAPLHFAEQTTSVVGAIAVDDAAIYFVESEPVPERGKGKVVAPPPPSPSKPAQGAKVFSSPLADAGASPPRTLLACQPEDVPLFLAVDDTYLYWAATSGQIKRILRVPSSSQ